MVAEIVAYLRDVALICVKFSRACPHAETARGLEELAADLMVKASDIEQTMK